MARDGTRSLAGGAVVETRLVARLLGLKLLVVDGQVTVWPARPVQPVLPLQPVHPVAIAPGRRAEPDPAGGRLEATAVRLEGTAQRLRQLRAGS